MLHRRGISAMLHSRTANKQQTNNALRADFVSSK